MTDDVVSGGPPDRHGWFRPWVFAPIAGAVIALVFVLIRGSAASRQPVDPLAGTPWAGERLDAVLYADAHNWQLTEHPHAAVTVEMALGNQGHLPVTIYRLTPTSPVLHLVGIGVEQPPAPTHTGTLLHPVVLQPGKFVQIEVALTMGSCQKAQQQPGALRVAATRGDSPESSVLVSPTGTNANSPWTTGGAC